MEEKLSTIVEEARIPCVGQQDFLLRITSAHGYPSIRKQRNHFHVEFEIALFVSGSGTYFVHGEEYDIKPGDVFLFSSNEQHCITRIHEPEDMLWINLHFEPRFIWAPGNELFDSKYLQIFFEKDTPGQNRLDRENPAIQVVRDQILQLKKELCEKAPEYALMAKANLLTILVTILRYFRESKAQTNYSTSANAAKIEKSMAYIQQNITEYLDLNVLAQTANMSVSYFSTVFKRLNGISPWEYIIVKRINYAVELLKDPSQTILSVALKSGFNNTANFNQAFKKVTGLSPSQYRSDDNF